MNTDSNREETNSQSEASTLSVAALETRLMTSVLCKSAAAHTAHWMGQGQALAQQSLKDTGGRDSQGSEPPGLPFTLHLPAT